MGKIIKMEKTAFFATHYNGVPGYEKTRCYVSDERIENIITGDAPGTVEDAVGMFLNYGWEDEAVNHVQHILITCENGHGWQLPVASVYFKATEVHHSTQFDTIAVSHIFGSGEIKEHLAENYGYGQDAGQEVVHELNAG